MSDMDRLKGSVEQRIRRIRKAEGERDSLMGFTAYLGTLGLLIALPVVGGAYLGVWLDKSHGTYGWTPLLIFAGVALGAANVYLFVKR